jgi:hypothetical protein
MSRWVRFEPVDNPGRKTRVWEVWSVGGVRLGEIKWWGRWRAYCFFPEEDTLYNMECLKDIAIFIDQQMAERRIVRR